ncbi:helix-turn-helix transcriptional regulator [Jeotgalibacillus aurantiacus]|uniref:helix-turn-helix transcriptional regulator n=1 Tax=Jeotgalibacillus aurantiacus TaxID=2763266 RepID=UPI001D0BD6E1|nr:helix-turn-helix transcriptional regulator [Jeotgalibacillus aurantiacus]
MLKNSVKEWRMRNGLTQQELADRMGITRQTIGLIEKGDYAPSVLLALRMAAVMGVRVEDLFRVEEDKNA